MEWLQQRSLYLIVQHLSPPVFRVPCSPPTDVPAWGPHITGVSHGMRVNPDDVVNAQCELDLSDPPADFTWFVNHKEPPSPFQVSQGRPTGKDNRLVQMSVSSATS